jgi:hypothetical protein
LVSLAELRLTAIFDIQAFPLLIQRLFPGLLNDRLCPRIVQLNDFIPIAEETLSLFGRAMDVTIEHAIHYLGVEDLVLQEFARRFPFGAISTSPSHSYYRLLFHEQLVCLQHNNLV